MLGFGVLVALVLLALGVPIFGVFLFLTTVGAVDSPHTFFQEFGGAVQSLFSLGTSPITAPILSTIPLFILAGFLMAESKTADRTRAGGPGGRWAGCPAAWRSSRSSPARCSPPSPARPA